MGAATKVSLRFDRPWWRSAAAGRTPSARTCRAARVWESGEEQRAAVLTLLGGASASATLAEAAGDPTAIADAAARLRGTDVSGDRWSGPAVSWEHERVVDGRLRRVRARPSTRATAGCCPRAHGRVLFAGEHTSERWQGFMNGAVESGQAAARRRDRAGAPPAHAC